MPEPTGRRKEGSRHTVAQLRRIFSDGTFFVQFPTLEGEKCTQKPVHDPRAAGVEVAGIEPADRVRRRRCSAGKKRL